MNQKQKERLAALIQSSPDRARIERALAGLFGATDIRQIDHPNLDVFLRDVLPHLSPETFRQGKA